MFKKLWSTKNIIFSVLVLTLLYWLPKISGIIMLFFAAYVIACALNPFVIKLSKKMSRVAASTLVLLISILSMVLLCIPVIFLLYNELKGFWTIIPDKILQLTNFLTSFTLHGRNVFDFLEPNALISSSSHIAQNLFNQSWNLTIGAFQLIMLLIIMTMIIYYILSDKPYLRSKFLEFFPSTLKDKAGHILSSISGKVGGYVRAQILSMVAIAIMMTIGLSLLGVQYATLLGIISGVLDIVPILGPTIALLLIILIAYPVSLVKLALIIVLFLIVQQLSNYVVRPVLFGKFMALHPLMVFFALFVAEQFLGFWGVILSPAIAATICVLIDELYLCQINNKKINVQLESNLDGK